MLDDIMTICTLDCYTFVFIMQIYKKDADFALLRTWDSQFWFSDLKHFILVNSDNIDELVEIHDCTN